MKTPHPAHQDFVEKIWKITGPYPFVAALVADTPKDSPYIGGKLHSFCRGGYFRILKTYSTQRYTVYQFNPDIAAWCFAHLGTPDITEAEARTAVRAYQIRVNYDKHRVVLV